MALEGQAHLHDAPAQQDQPHCPDQAEDEVAQIVDHPDGIAGRESGDSKAGHRREGDNGGAAVSTHRAGQVEPLFFSFVHFGFPPV